MAWRLALSRYSRRHIRGLRTQPRYDYTPAHSPGDSPFAGPAHLSTPRELVRFLDEYVVGQEYAKKVLSVAVYNHYSRVRTNFTQIPDYSQDYEWEADKSLDEGGDERPPVTAAELHPHPYRSPPVTAIPASLPSRHLPPTVEKSNVLVIGPTGSGKTLLVKTLARVLDVPFSVSDATSFTQAGYVGEDVDMCIQRLLQAANWDPYRASTGIVYIDEVDKLARRSAGPEGSRDVGGEGVQQALLRMMEGSMVTVQAKGPEIGTPGGEGRSRTGQRPPPAGPKHDTYLIDTSNVLFIFSGAFVGLDAILRQRLAKGSIGFTANLSSFADDNLPKLPFFTPNTKSNPLERVEPADLVKFGFIPEFVSRMPVVTTLASLSQGDLFRILTRVRGSLVSQYTELFRCSGVEIRFTDAGLREICRQAAEHEVGARGLRGIMESLLLDAMYEVPGSDIRYVLINESAALRQKSALYWRRGEGAAWWAAWADEK